MITRIEALGYRGLKYVSQRVGPFQVLIGPNASGKTTFLDTVGFLGDLVRAGANGAILGDARLGVPERARDAKQLTWMRSQARFELAVELQVPEQLRAQLDGRFHTCRYEVAVEADKDVALSRETFWLKPRNGPEPVLSSQRELFPVERDSPESIALPPRKRTPTGWKKIVSRGEDPKNVQFSGETKKWVNAFRLGPARSALANVPDDASRFPITTWARGFLAEGVQKLVLSSEAMRRPSPPGRTLGFLPDGSNLPWVVERLDAKRKAAWLKHVRLALPDLKGIGTREREEDRHRYLVLKYQNGLEAPSWLVSDGTLRLLALTLLAYVPELAGVFLIEEPENGIHPSAVDVVFQSLSEVRTAQVLCATHSPVVLARAHLGQVLCFARAANGETDVIEGPDHPRLRSWKGEVDLGTLFAGGVLG